VWRKLFSSSEVAKNFAILLTGTIIAQVIPFALSPLLSRIYTPQDFGFYSTITSFISVLSVIVCFRYEQSIILPKEDKDSTSIISLALRISLIVSVSIFVFLFFLHERIAALLHITQNSKWLFIVPFLLLFVGIQQCFNYWLIRKKAFKRNSTNKIVQTASVSFISLLLGYLAVKGGLLIGYLTGWALLAGFSYYQAIKENYNTDLVNQKTRFFNMKKYSDFPVFNILPALFNAIATILPIFYISTFYDQATTGYYNHTRLIILAPLSLITVAMSQVYFERIATKVKNADSILPELKGIVVMLMVLALVMIVLVILFAPTAFGFLFGESWTVAGEYARILIFSYAIQFIVSPLSNVLTALNRIKLASLWPFLYFGLMLSLSLYRKASISKFITILTVIDVVSYGVYAIMIIWAVREYEHKRQIIAQ
jgi:O-antigen/teichoic acid export membrane protein